MKLYIIDIMRQPIIKEHTLTEFQRLALTSIFWTYYELLTSLLYNNIFQIINFDAADFIFILYSKQIVVE